ncbi:SRPBCC family protein [Henriciella pelagia]|jgi:uncharacterized protein YndB with AHSA1/START domain|uniref:Vanillate O-demethylase oxidoreductase VanB n=1 Tax=Henriciella pelagia TaxID=1977912 RepID=A0ABQ1JT63_9PROT|nr:SRPBCC family protein [Henriciella pelagia]GGB76167.1 vanillate O-demethylase oxidoreductase VanB [Henriciella pelagia]
MTDRIEKTTTLKSSIDKVWDAITDHEKFGEWFKVKLYNPFVEGEMTRGHITHPEAEGMVWESVTRDIRPKTYFSFVWYHDATQAGAAPKRCEMLVEFILKPMNGGTHLTIIESGFDAVPQPESETIRTRNDGGWAEQIRNIEAYVDG